MPKRFSIPSLMAVILLIGLGLAAMRSASFLCLQVIYTATVVALLLSILLAKYSRSDSPFYIGFAVFGWGYFLLAIGPWTFWITSWVSGRGIVLATRAYVLLLSNYPIDFLAVHLASETVSVPVQGADAIVQSSDIAAGVGHILFVWLFGLVGGLMATYLSSRRGARSQEKEAPDEGSARRD
jgi:hypothetical protein